MLKQKNNDPVEVAHQVCIIYAVTHGYLNTIPVEKIPEFEDRLFRFLDDSQYNSLLTAIRQTGKLESDTEEALKAALTQLVSQFNPAE